LWAQTVLFQSSNPLATSDAGRGFVYGENEADSTKHRGVAFQLTASASGQASQIRMAGGIGEGNGTNARVPTGFILRIFEDSSGRPATVPLGGNSYTTSQEVQVVDNNSSDVQIISFDVQGVAPSLVQSQTYWLSASNTLTGASDDHYMVELMASHQRRM
jgi:hypothetical protein